MEFHWLYGCKIIVIHCVQKWGGNFYVSGRDDIFLLDAGIRGCQINDTGLQPFSKLPQNFEFNVPTCRNKSYLIGLQVQASLPSNKRGTSNSQN